jgi:hypothetical protein
MIRAMARRLVAWLCVIPVAGLGILVGHELAYRLTATSQGSMHEYLAHGPQILAVLASVGLAGLAVQERSAGVPPAWAFALVGPVGFVLQEHVERLVHTGGMPLILTSPAFLVGLALQLPAAVACAWIASRVVGKLDGVRVARRAVLGEIWLPLPEAPADRPACAPRRRATGRGPPALLVS